MPPADAPREAAGPRGTVAELLQGSDASVLDLVDHVLNQGVVIHAELVLGVADIDLIYMRLSALLCAADRLLDDTTGRSRHPEAAGTELGDPDRPGSRPRSSTDAPGAGEVGP